MDTKKVDTTEIKTMSQVSILWNSVRSFLVNKQNLSEYKIKNTHLQFCD